MAKNLIELISASGGAGSAGQSFKGNVSPTQAVSDMTGFKLSDYLVTAVSWSGYPQEATAYSDNHLFNITATITRNPQAYRIQRLNSSAFAITLSYYSGDYGNGSYTVESFSANGSPQGSSYDVGIRVRGPEQTAAGSATAVINYTYRGDSGTPLSQPPSTAGVEWSGNYTVSASNTNIGSSQLSLRIVYDPDVAQFNNTYSTEGTSGTSGATGDYMINITNAGLIDTDLEVRWWSNQTDANNNDTGAGSYIGAGRIINWISYAISSGTNQSVWWRWRASAKGITTWSTASALSVAETRLDA